MTAPEDIAAAIVEELRRQADESTGIMMNDVDIAFGLDSAMIDGTFDLVRVGAALIAAGWRKP